MTKIINTTISSVNIHCIERVVDIAQQMQIKYVLVFLASIIKPDVVEQAVLGAAADKCQIKS